MEKFKANRYTTEVYNLLLAAAERGEGLTRAEMQQQLRKRFNDNQWAAIMRKVRERVVMDLGLIIPDATKELGHRYYITDDPNHVVPGMLAKLRSQATISSKVVREREFIRFRDDRVNDRRNRRVLEHADILIDMHKLLEKPMQIANENMRDAMDERLESDEKESA